MQNSATNS